MNTPRWLISLLLPCVPVVAAAVELPGAWTATDRAGEAIYETLDISASEISWGSENNPNSGLCRSGYRRVHQGEGTTYPGNILGGPDEGEHYETAIVALDEAECTRQARYLLFAQPESATPTGSQAYMVSFDANWGQTGWHNLEREPADAAP